MEERLRESAGMFSSLICDTNGDFHLHFGYYYLDSLAVEHIYIRWPYCF